VVADVGVVKGRLAEQSERLCSGDRGGEVASEELVDDEARIVVDDVELPEQTDVRGDVDRTWTVREDVVDGVLILLGRHGIDGGVELLGQRFPEVVDQRDDHVVPIAHVFVLVLDGRRRHVHARDWPGGTIGIPILVPQRADRIDLRLDVNRVGKLAFGDLAGEVVVADDLQLAAVDRVLPGRKAILDVQSLVLGDLQRRRRMRVWSLELRPFPFRRRPDLLDDALECVTIPAFEIEPGAERHCYRHATEPPV